MLIACLAGVGIALLVDTGASASPAPSQTSRPSAQEGGEFVRGTLENDNEPVEGVEITIETADGEEVGVVVSEPDGGYELQLPGPGEYTATIDLDSLPDGVDIRNEDRTTLEFRITPNQSRPLIFPLGEAERQSKTEFEKFLQLLVEGVKFGLVIAMGAIGLSLIFGTTGLTNFSHGEMVTFGALVAYYINVHMNVPLVPAAVLAMGVGAIAGAIYDRFFWRILRRRGTGLIAMLVISIGMSIVFRYLFLYQFGGDTRPFADYQVQRAMEFGPVSIAAKDIASIIVSIVVLGGVGLLLQRSRIGKAIRAGADNRDLAESSGIDVDRVILLVWACGGGLAALGGVLLAATEEVGFQMGFRLLLLMFAGVTLGGLGTAYGALVGSLIVGIFIQVSTLWIPTGLKNVGALAILILILLVRPQGILGQRERVG